MSISQKKSLRKITGGRFKSLTKKLATMGDTPTFTKVGEHKVKQKRKIGGNLKFTLLTTNKVNVLNPKTKKSQITEITAVLENNANRNFIRRSIVTKGALINTPLGKAKITSRPGQVATLNAILVE